MKKNFIEDNLYKKIVENIPISTVDVLLFSRDLKKVLLFLRNNEPAKGEYYSLGGKLNKCETFSNCAKRKLKEEVGIVENKGLVFIDILSETFSNCFFSNDIPTHFVNIYYALICDESIKITLDSQHAKYRWIDVSDSSLNDYMKIKIQKSLEELKK